MFYLSKILSWACSFKLLSVFFLQSRAMIILPLLLRRKVKKGELVITCCKPPRIPCSVKRDEGWMDGWIDIPCFFRDEMRAVACQRGRVNFASPKGFHGHNLLQKVLFWLLDQCLVEKDWFSISVTTALSPTSPSGMGRWRTAAKKQRGLYEYLSFPVTKMGNKTSKSAPGGGSNHLPQELKYLEACTELPLLASLHINGNNSCPKFSISAWGHKGWEEWRRSEGKKQPCCRSASY